MNKYKNLNPVYEKLYKPRKGLQPQRVWWDMVKMQSLFEINKQAYQIFYVRQ